MLIDKEAFAESNMSSATYVMKEFWKSPNNKIIIARKSNTKAIVGYAIFSVSDPKDLRFGKNKRI